MATPDRYLPAARALFEQIARDADLPLQVELWDGSRVALGANAGGNAAPALALSDAGVLRRLLRRPTLETVARLYADGRIAVVGMDLLGFVERARQHKVRLRLGDLDKWALVKRAWPLLFAPDRPEHLTHVYAGDATGRAQTKRDERAFIQFHYDVSNAFYRLFLDPEMQYSCAYFTAWDNGIQQAQHDKLEMICRKLRLNPGDRFLDVGCGWGGLICHAARHHGVQAHGVTLSKTQYDWALGKIAAEGLQDRVTVELKDYRELTGPYDKIASIGMYEHVGIQNYPDYFSQLNRLLADRGLLLNHGITRGAKKSARRFNRIRPENRLIRKYIFPGSELDHIGHTLSVMEAHRFQVHDVEGWREHYAWTTRLWYRALIDREAAARAEVGDEKYRMWIAYLAGVSLSFQDGSLRIFQTLASKHKGKGPSGLPPTRADLYRDAPGGL
ncbi:SAM-dependent methyltransferase [Rhodovibrio salinarum]|uniref:Class I SAM-dependent methyltransferase n=1 Tax=Rhodovibrio salinarum TaxID=1087 RepID=A0A934UYT5_9PROT|nr:cyclopropane-fatty-acyl-phospholipid synthase family protein [Rhodovibrio salinarum]MBK1695804.1 class I SAM-dependent methyltransferase [Rhodovibrio salinarum]